MKRSILHLHEQRLQRFILMPILVLTLLITTTAAAGLPTVTIGEVAGKRGDTVELTAALTSGGSIAGGGFNICYDPAVLELVDAQKGTLLAGSIATINKKYADNKIRINFAGTTALGADGILLNLTFCIKNDCTFGESIITVEKLNLYDENSASVAGITASGKVNVQHATLKIKASEGAPGQSVRTSLEVGGDLLPAGGTAELAYDATKLEPTSAVAGNALREFGTLTANLNYKPGVIKLSWAGSDALPAGGELCIVAFRLKMGAQGTAALSLKTVSLFDIGPRPVDCVTTDGAITVIPVATDRPVITAASVKGKANNQVDMYIYVSENALVYGGGFCVHYDKAMLSLTSAVGLRQNNGVTPTVNGKYAEGVTYKDDAAYQKAPETGTVKISWAGAAPMNREAAMVKLTFKILPKLTITTDVNIADAKLYDESGNIVKQTSLGGTVALWDKKVTSTIQPPPKAPDEVKVQVALTSVGAQKTSKATALLVLYKDGKMVNIVTKELVPGTEDAAANSLVAASDGAADSCQVIICEDMSSLTPLCAGQDFNLQ